MGDVYGYDLSSTVLETQENISKSEDNGFCLGTLFVALMIMGASRLARA